MPRRTEAPQRLLTTVLFTDIVASTQRASELGDKQWRRLISSHHALVRRDLRRHNGREIDTAGDGFFATFDQPAQAIGCALAIVDGVRRLGIEVRAGIHMGEVEVIGPKVVGLVVHIGARVMSKAGPGQVLVSSTVRDLMAGSELTFEDLGEQELKGLSAPMRLYAVERTTAVEPEAEPSAQAEEEPTRHRPRVFIALAAGVTIAVVAAVLLVNGRGGALPPPTSNSLVRLNTPGSQVLGSISVGRTPIAVASDESTIWVANYDDGTVQSVDTSTNTASPAIGLGFSVAPNAIAVGGGFVWVTSGTTGTLYRIDPTQTHAITPIQLGIGLAGVAYGDGAIWVTNQNEDSVVRVDPENLRRPYPMVTLKAGSAPIGITTNGQDVWVAESLAGAVARIDPDTMTVTKVVPLVRGNPAQVSYGEGFVWVTATDDDSVTRIDPSTSQGTTIPDVGDGPTGVAVGDGAAWIADSLDGSVSKIDPGTATVVERFPLGPVLSPDGVATTPGSVWISVHDR